MAIRGPREILTYRGEGVPIINLINAIHENAYARARVTQIRSLVIFNTTERCTSSPIHPHNPSIACSMAPIHTHLRAAIRLPGAAQTSGGAGGCLAHIVQPHHPRPGVHGALTITLSLPCLQGPSSQYGGWRSVHRPLTLVPLVCCTSSRLGDRHLVPHTTLVRVASTLDASAPACKCSPWRLALPAHHAGARREHFRWRQTSRECAG